MSQKITGQYFSLSICVIFLCLICFPAAQGFKCYECVETADSSLDLRDSNACVNVIKSGRTTNCLSTASAPYCLKIDGVQDGNHIAIRKCATDDWKIMMRSTDKCTRVEELNRRGSGRTKIKIDRGMACICDADYCNHGRNVRSGLGFIFAMSLASIISRFC